MEREGYQPPLTERAPSQIREKTPWAFSNARRMLIKARDYLLLAGVAVAGCGDMDQVDEGRLEAYSRRNGQAELKLGPEKMKEMQREKDLTLLRSLYGEHFTKAQRNISRERIEGGDRQPLIVEGFEEIGLDSAKLREAMMSVFPKGWATEAVLVNYIDEERVLDSGYGDKLHGDLKAADASTDESGVSAIDFYKYDKGRTKSAIADKILSMLSHESGHFNDWDTDDTCSAEENLQLLTQVSKRYFLSGNSYHSDYVKNINNPDPHKNNYLRIKEYWGEICKGYFRNSEAMQKNHPEDFAVVDWYVKLHDPDFKPKGVNERRQLLDKAFPN